MVNAIGSLTLHGVTKTVTVPLEAQRKGEVIAVVGSLEVPFADYSISQPRGVGAVRRGQGHLRGPAVPHPHDVIARP